MIALGLKDVLLGGSVPLVQTIGFGLLILMNQLHAIRQSRRMKIGKEHFNAEVLLVIERTSARSQETQE